MRCLLYRVADIGIVSLHPVSQGARQHRPGADLPDADRGVGPRSSAPGGGPGGRRRVGADEALAQGHPEKGAGEGCTEHRL